MSWWQGVAFFAGLPLAAVGAISSVVWWATRGQPARPYPQPSAVELRATDPEADGDDPPVADQSDR